MKQSCPRQQSLLIDLVVGDQRITLLSTKTFRFFCSSSRQETPFGEQAAVDDRKLTQTSDRTSFDIKLIFENLVVFGTFVDVGADVF